eukprot:TRINITY_DN450_c0_g2_i2.p1 TRINITY_DN450_c0_g2~~TRINITY_DN450_c0_g2_i2.p1  ORF type:complete len:163 (-),score=39.73 TRINITY_DN450_c0_g2_i2:391-879(-)
MGYAAIFVANAATAGNLLMVEKIAGVKEELSSWGLLYYNTFLSLPFALIMFLASGELPRVLEYEFLWSPMFQAFLTFAASQAFLLNLSIFLCTSLNSSLTTSVTGQMKNILTTLLGFVWFGDVIYDQTNVMGMFISLLGSLYYAYVKYTESQAKKQAQARAL